MPSFLHGFFKQSHSLCCAFLLLTISFGSSGSTLLTTSSGNQSDHFALLAIKSQIADDPLSALSSWNDSLHHCDWQGITCSSRHAGRVTILSLEYQNLGGTLSPYLGNLAFLQQIDLSGNNFHGKIPSSLGNLSSLIYLSFRENRLEGSIPEHLCRIRNLEFFQVSQNKLSGKVPSCLYNNSNMYIFSVAMNQLEGSLPQNIDLTLGNIKIIIVEFNFFGGPIPFSLSNATKLESMYFGSNNFTGSVPRNLGRLHDLGIVDFNSNQLGTETGDDLGFITSLTNCSNLSFLDFERNSLKGPLPDSISGLSAATRIKFLYAGDNRIYGNIPMGIYLYKNYLTGNIPAVIGKLNYLSVLDISENKLSGHIPELLGDCLSLLTLHMGDNFLDGRIPKSMDALTSLESLDLSRNNLSGEIPEFLERFPLIKLNLSFNQLEGHVPHKGVFGNAGLISVVGNKDLCGGIVELKLSSCIKKTKKRSFPIKVISSIVGSMSLLLLLCVFLVCYRRKMMKKQLYLTPFIHQSYKRVSYAELLIATNGFSTDNLIGVGSYGSVFKGTLQDINKIVAVKVLNLRREEASKSFQTECKALRNLRHRNLLKIITSCSTVDFQGNDFKALVFEFMPNGSLEEWLHPRLDEQQFRTKNLNFIQRLGIAIDVAFALEYLHHHCQPGIVHCDLKPSNVLLSDDMTAHVADFGIAKIFSSPFHDSTQSSFVVKGSIGYVAPEYGMGVKASTQGDVYSYGILLLEMFTGKKPTNDIFLDGLSLNNYSKMALPCEVMNIVDPMVLVENNDVLNTLGQSNRRDRLQECLISAIKLGIACSAESPVERMPMTEVVTVLHRIRGHHEGVRSHGVRDCPQSSLTES